MVSARYTVAVPLPGDSPFKKPPGNVAQTMAVQFGGMGVLLLLVAPEIALVAAQFITGSAVPGWINLALGPVWAWRCSWPASGWAGSGWTRAGRSCWRSWWSTGDRPTTGRSGIACQ